MASEGPLNSSNISESGSGTSWTNITSAGASDNSYATCSLAAFGTSKRINFFGFGFAIPSGATIDGIVVEAETKADAGSCFFNDARLYKAGSVVGSAKSSGGFWGTSDAYETIGASNDLWGTTWTDSEINDSLFGVRLTGKNNAAAARVLSVDHVRITVYYTAGGGGGGTVIPVFMNQYRQRWG